MGREAVCRETALEDALAIFPSAFHSIIFGSKFVEETKKKGKLINNFSGHFYLMLTTCFPLAYIACMRSFCSLQLNEVGSGNDINNRRSFPPSGPRWNVRILQITL